MPRKRKVAQSGAKLQQEQDNQDSDCDSDYNEDMARSSSVSGTKRIRGDIAANPSDPAPESTLAPDALLCAICYDLLVEPVMGPCGHDFCHACLTTWRERCSTCPICRASLPDGKLAVCRRLSSIVEGCFPKELAARRASLTAAGGQHLTSDDSTKALGSHQAIPIPPLTVIAPRPSSDVLGSSPSSSSLSTAAPAEPAPAFIVRVPAPVPLPVETAVLIPLPGFQSAQQQQNESAPALQVTGSMMQEAESISQAQPLHQQFDESGPCTPRAGGAGASARAASFFGAFSPTTSQNSTEIHPARSLSRFSILLQQAQRAHSQHLEQAPAFDTQSVATTRPVARRLFQSDSTGSPQPSFFGLSSGSLRAAAGSAPERPDMAHAQADFGSSVDHTLAVNHAGYGNSLHQRIPPLTWPQRDSMAPNLYHPSSSASTQPPAATTPSMDNVWTGLQLPSPLPFAWGHAPQSAAASASSLSHSHRRTASVDQPLPTGLALTQRLGTQLWHCADADNTMRAACSSAISSLVPDAAQGAQPHHQRVHAIEAHLYNSAVTRLEYADLSTLPIRVQRALQELGMP